MSNKVWLTDVENKLDNPTPGHISGKYNSKRYMHPMFIAALVTTVKTWKQPKCPLIGDWIKKMWHK